MTDLEQLTKELAMVKSRETDQLLELEEPEAKNPQEWSRLSVREAPETSAGTLFGSRTVISDQEMLRVNDPKDLVEESYHKMFREISAAMAVADYVVNLNRVRIDFDRNERICATELAVRVVGEEPPLKLPVEELVEVNLEFLNCALKDKNERR